MVFFHKREIEDLDEAALPGSLEQFDDDERILAQMLSEDIEEGCPKNIAAALFVASALWGVITTLAATVTGAPHV